MNMACLEPTSFLPYQRALVKFKGLYQARVDPNLGERFFNVHSPEFENLKPGDFIDRPLLLGMPEIDLRYDYLRKILPFWQYNILTQISETPVYLFNHHGSALYAWAEAHYLERLKPGAILVHFDFHDDARLTKEHLPLGTDRLGEIYRLCHGSKKTEDTYIDLAISAGLVSEYYWLTSDPYLVNSPFDSIKLLKSKHLNLLAERIPLAGHAEAIQRILASHKDVILNLDLDFITKDLENCLPELFSNFSRLFPKVKIMTVALSPTYHQLANESTISASKATSIFLSLWKNLRHQRSGSPG